jgi:hypothetical protein
MATHPWSVRRSDEGYDARTASESPNRRAVFLIDFTVFNWLAERYEEWGLVFMFALFMVAFLAGWYARTLAHRPTRRRPEGGELLR